MTLTPQEVKRRLDAGEPLRLIDVREPDEFALARIDGAELVPLRTVGRAVNGLREERRPLIVFCHHGLRSLQVVSWLRQRGLGNCFSMEGGIDRWSLEIDPSVPRYF
ncbi:MAG: rhodanese [Bryobacterales bacterium]|nr:rhodanese [Bryobacterales bacterium]